MKEILVGSGLALVIFLVIIGINITPFLLIGLIAGAFYYFIHVQGGIKFNEVGQGIKGDSLVSFEDIGGQDVAINELREALEFILQPEEIGKMGIRPLKGILLVGPPGTGKTLMARAAASYTNSAFVSVSGSEFIEIYAGVGAKRVRQLFKDARKKAAAQKCGNAIIFIDELEILGTKRGSHNSHLEYDQTINQLLVEMDGIIQNEETKILVIGATNRADMLDPALLRPGRFDRQVQVGLPDKEGRTRILRLHTRNKPLKEGIALDDIARATFGFSGAHLESLSNEAAILAMRENKETIEERHFDEAIDKVIMGEKLDRKPSLLEIERVSIHESGHALVSEILQSGSVASLTIVPRGGALGYMRKSPEEDQYLHTRDELDKQIMVALAGALAEEMRYGQRSTGAQNDFSQVWNISRTIIEAGLSSLGIVHDADIPRDVFYNECKEIISELEEKTRKILLDNEKTLYAIAQFLRDKETIDRKSFVGLMKKAS